MAPRASIVLMTSPVDETEGVQGLPQFNALENFALNHRLGQVISQSWGATENTLFTRAGKRVFRSFEATYARAARMGVTVLASTGDAGTANVDVSGKIYPFPTVNFPASSPLVTAVGGTSLTADTQRQLPVRDGMELRRRRHWRRHQPVLPRAVLPAVPACLGPEAAGQPPRYPGHLLERRPQHADPDLPVLPGRQQGGLLHHRRHQRGLAGLGRAGGRRGPAGPSPGRAAQPLPVRARSRGHRVPRRHGRQQRPGRHARLQRESRLGRGHRVGDAEPGGAGEQTSPTWRRDTHQKRLCCPGRSRFGASHSVMAAARAMPSVRIARAA